MPTEPLRIALVAACPFPWPRGTPIRIHGLARAYGELGHEVHVVTYHLGKAVEDEPYELHRTRRVGWYRRVEAGPSYRKLVVMDPLLAGELKNLLRARRIDVIHAHHYEGLLVAGWAARGRVPVVYDAHTTLESELPFYSLGLPHGFKRWAGRLGDRHLTGLADHIVAVTEAIRERLLAIEAVPEERIDVVSNGVEIERFDVGVGGSSEGVVDSAPTIVYAGNLAPYQGIHPLLEAFSRVRRSEPSARLLILTGDSFEPFQDCAGELGIREAIEVIDTTFDELPGLLARADVAVNARAVCEGIPQKNMNYLAAGKPLVAFRASAKPSIDGQTGISVRDGDVDALADALVKLLAEPETRARLGRAARRMVETEMTWPVQAGKVVAIFRGVMARHADR